MRHTAAGKKKKERAGSRTRKLQVWNTCHVLEGEGWRLPTAILSHISHHSACAQGSVWRIPGSLGLLLPPAGLHIGLDSACGSESGTFWIVSQLVCQSKPASDVRWCGLQQSDWECSQSALSSGWNLFGRFGAYISAPPSLKEWIISIYLQRDISGFNTNAPQRKHLPSYACLTTTGSFPISPLTGSSHTPQPQHGAQQLPQPRKRRATRRNSKNNSNLPTPGTRQDLTRVSLPLLAFQAGQEPDFRPL
jgi:hypothetical protein